MGRNKEKSIRTDFNKHQKSTFNLKIITMKKTFINIFLAGTVILIAAVSCKKDDNPSTPVVYYEGGDQMARPAINTVFVDAPAKDSFNNTIPSMMSAKFLNKFKARLAALNPGYTTNALGQTADQLTGLLVTDVLNVSTTGTTTFFDGTNVLTGRTLSDDVIDVELILLFGGSDGKSNPGLTSDNVNANDKAFAATFPYLASPW
jgi:Domain of unknown function (DUF4331)